MVACTEQLTKSERQCQSVSSGMILSVLSFFLLLILNTSKLLSVCVDVD